MLNHENLDSYFASLGVIFLNCKRRGSCIEPLRAILTYLHDAVRREASAKHAKSLVRNVPHKCSWRFDHFSVFQLVWEMIWWRFKIFFFQNVKIHVQTMNENKIWKRNGWDCKWSISLRKSRMRVHIHPTELPLPVTQPCWVNKRSFLLSWHKEAHVWGEGTYIDIQSPTDRKKTQLLALSVIRILCHVPGGYIRTQPSNDSIIY